MSSNELVNMLFSRVQRSEERADRVYEAVVGIVVDNKDPDKLARVKVRFPSLPGQDTSWWAPVTSLGAGADRGWFFLPEIDDEVLVMFSHGDIRRPIVLGAIWNGQDAPPESNGSGSNDRRIIVSREGSSIIFDDEAGTIELADGGGEASIVISTENKITIDSSGDIGVLAASGELSIVANEARFEGSQSCHIEAQSGGEKLTSGGKLTIKGGSMLKVHGSQTQILPGGVSAAAEASDSCESVPDPLE